MEGNCNSMKKTTLVLFSLFAGLMIICACEKEGENETKISANGHSESHNMGQNCMSCHRQGGEGEGWFIAAGTVYDESKTGTLPNGTIVLYSGPDGSGTIAYTLEVDANGNFYTTENIDFGSGLYPAAVGAQTTKYMVSAVTSGQCNSCHGDSTDKIWTK